MRRNKKLTFMLILVILVMCLTVGYAVLSTTLNINGTSTINNARWDIHFEHIVPTGTVQPTTAAQINAAGNTITYAVSLSKPGDFYEFMVDVKNAGTIDGMVESITSKLNNNPITTLPAYLEYYVTYSDDIPIEPNHLLAANSTEKYVVHIGFKEDINASDLPGSAQTFNMSFEVMYTQATSDAVVKPYYAYTIDYNASGWNINVNQLDLYNNYNDVINNSNHPFFMKLKIEQNQIADTELAFEFMDGNVYSLKAYMHSEEDYEYNIDKLTSIFGAENCSMNVNYGCQIGTYSISISDTIIYVANNNDTLCEIVSLTDGGYSWCRAIEP